MTEKSRRYSTYTYCLDNPIRFIDPDGMEVIETHNGFKFTEEHAIEFFKQLQAGFEDKKADENTTNESAVNENDINKNAANAQTNKSPLPTWSSMDMNYPKNSAGDDMPSSEVYKLVGGPIYNLYLSEPENYANACALRVSYALNKSGVLIPAVEGTFKGGDGNNYFLSASKLNTWMISYFGAPDISARSNFESTLQGNQGIYIMLPNYPGKFYASGHATLFNGTNCIGNHCYFNAAGGVFKTNLWILK